MFDTTVGLFWLVPGATVGLVIAIVTRRGLFALLINVLVGAIGGMVVTGLSVQLGASTIYAITLSIAGFGGWGANLAVKAIVRRCLRIKPR